MSSKAITIAICGQSRLYQAALERLVATLPGLTVVTETAIPPPQVILWQPGRSGLVAVPDHAPETALLALVEDAQDGVFPPGIAGLFAGNETPAALGVAVRQVSRGQQYLSPQLALAFLRRQQETAEDVPFNLDALTRREREILMLLGDGLSNKAIAAQLYLSVRTVEGHLAKLYAKLGVHTRTEAALIAMRSFL